MQILNKQLLVVGDRVLVKPDDPDERNKVGLYLPQSVAEKDPVRSGTIVETGPGIAIPNFHSGDPEPWEKRANEPVRYLPVAAKVGDFVLFMRKDAVEIQYDGQAFLVVPQNALLLIVRDDEAVSE